MTSNSSNSANSPFEWLAGGLFFGNNSNKKASNAIASIEASKDIPALVQGLNDNFSALHDRILQGRTATPVQQQDGNATTTTNEPTDTEFLAARLARLRCLLYEERQAQEQQQYRRQQQQQQQPPVVLGNILHLVTEGFPRLLLLLLQCLHELPFESRKHVAAIFNYMLVCGLAGEDAANYLPYMMRFVQYVESQIDFVLQVLVQGHDSTASATASNGTTDVCLHYGSMFRSCLRHATLFRHVVGSSAHVERYVLPFLDHYVHDPNFDIASDAMESVRAIFTTTTTSIPTTTAMANGNDELIAEMLVRDYQVIWQDRFHNKLLSTNANYMTRRVALQVLSTVLLTRTNYNFMIQYVASRQNLVSCMHLLRDTSPHITMDAFHVFKVFVANPNKPPEIVKILKDNQEKLCKYLRTLHQDKEANDTQFRDEKALIVATIEAL